MLALRPNCEFCDSDLPAESKEAYICSFECTFCHRCVTHKLHGVCPNCNGELVCRPIRPKSALERHPASIKRVHSNKNDSDRFTIKPTTHI
ncbi:DUF1272 domain-containing protein [Rosenbergiella nectarea]|uniref:DUF1272 domain-containing protein n=1 Tax=Rosenbergiella nectarea TaxID=988801 RepID=UPI001F4F035A|nr:DUF1272 domain-containing protein [Rosenbergiella nectarea]